MAFTGATAGLAAGAQTNDTRMDFALETTYATPPTGNYQALRITGESFSRAQTTSRPEEINSLKEVSQDVVTQISASGTISGALSSGTFDDLIAGVMGNDWAGPFVFTATATNSVRPNNSLLLFPSDNGKFVSSLPESGVFRITSQSKGWDYVGFYSYKPDINSLYIGDDFFTKYNWSDGLVSDTVVTVNGIVNDNLDKTFTIRKKLLGQFLLYPGSLITQVQFQLQQAQFGTVSIDATSANETLSSTDIAASVLPAPSGVVHNSVNNFLGASIFGETPEGCLTQFTCTLARDGSANDYGMGHADACGVRSGQFTASGSLEFYFRSWDEYNAALAGTQGQIVVKTVDDSGNGYAFIFTNAALRNGKVNSSQTNQTVKASFDIAGNPAAGGGTFAIMRLTGVAPTGS